MNWLLFSLLSVFCYSTANLLRRVLMKNDTSDPIIHSIVFQFICTMIVGGFALYKGFVLPPFSLYPINFLFQAVLYGLGTVCIFYANKYLEASESTIISTLESVVTIVTAVILLGEIFTMKNFIGALLIILAVIFVVYEKKFTLNKGILFTLGMSICYGLAITNDAFLVKRSEVFSYLTIGFLTPGLLLLLLYPKSLLKLGYYKDTKTLLKLFLLSFTYSVGAIFFFLALFSGAQASQLTPIGQSSVIVTVLLATLFLKERKNIFKKIVGSIFVFIGILLLK